MTSRPLILALGLCALMMPAVRGATPTDAQSAGVLQTKMVLRDLWVEHVFWVRGYMVAARTGNEAQRKEAENQIVANAKALAGSIVPFYGQAASDSLFPLLAGHWGAVKGYGTATYNGSPAGQQKSVEELTANAHAIAKFLNGANPHLPENAVFGLLSAHGTHHIAQIGAIHSGDYAEEAMVWKDMRHHMLMIADAITEALAKQFPEKF